MSERVEVDAVKFDEAIHMLKRLAYDEVKRNRGLVELGENHVVGHLTHAIDTFYEAIR